MITGLIMLWQGSIASIPNGWALCDGNNGTPDLRNKFVIGAGSTHAPNDIGGDTVHNHTFSGGGHNHNLIAGAVIGAGADIATSTSSSAAAGTTELDGALPPFYALAYIMKL